MSNIYTQFFVHGASELREEESKWVHELKELLEDFNEDVGIPEDSSIGAAVRNALILNDIEEWQLSGLTIDRHSEQFYIESDECGYPAVAATLLQMFLRKFRPLEHCSLGWACTGELFGGGEYLITADFIYSTDVSMYVLTEEYTKMKKANPTSTIAVAKTGTPKLTLVKE